jgi:hypothetical protein
MRAGLNEIESQTRLAAGSQGRLQAVADRFAEKYEDPFRFTVRDFAFYGEGGEALVFEVGPTRAFGYGRGEAFSATRWTFPGHDS